MRFPGWAREEASAKAERLLWEGGQRCTEHFKGLKVLAVEAENGFMNAKKLLLDLTAGKLLLTSVVAVLLGLWGQKPPSSFKARK